VLWDASDPTRSMNLVGHTGRVRRMVFSADQRTAYSVGDHTLRAWDLTTGRQRGVADLGDSAWDVALFGGVIATQDEAKPNKVALWSAADLRPIAAPGLTTRFYELYTANDHLLVGNDSEVDVIAPTGKPTGQFGFATGNTASISGSTVAVAGVAGDIALFEWPGLRSIRSWQSGAFITTMRFRPDGAILATVGDKRVRLWDPLSGRMLAELELPAILAQLAWSPDGTHLAIAGGSGTVWIWNLTPTDPASLSAYIKCASPWQLADTAIVAAPFDPATCSVLAR
jgi:WD40 repeat protein